MASLQDVINQALELHQAGALGQARELYQRIIEIAPFEATTHQLLGVLEHQTGNTPLGISRIRQALVIAPAEPLYLGNLATLLIAGADPAASAIAARSLILAPGYFEGTVNLATAELHEGATDRAIARLSELVHNHPELDSLHDLLASGQEESGQYALAIASRRRALCLMPDAFDSYQRMANTQVLHGQGREARCHFERCVIVHPTPGAKFRAAHNQDRVPENLEGVAVTRRRLEAYLDLAETRSFTIPDPLLAIGVTNFAFSYHDVTNRDLVRRIADYYLRSCPDIAWIAPHCHGIYRPSRRIRVAFVSVFLGAHTIGKLFSGIFECLSRDRFEVIAVSQAKPWDTAWREQMALADGQLNLAHDLTQARRQLADVEADVIVYFDIGMDPLTYYLAFARLAPIQAVCVGHPDTTGVPNIDYFLTSRGAEPWNWREHYTERAILLDEFPFFYRHLPTIRKWAGRAELGLPEHATLYTCPQTLFKMHPAYDSVFLEILRCDPAGRLVMIESAQAPETDRMRARLERAGPDVVDRVMFQRRMNGLEYLNFIRQADLVLETFAFSGGNSTFEALTTGTPILAYAGKHMRSRVTMDFFRLIGLENCVASDTDQFVKMALELAHDTERRREVQSGLLEAGPNLFERSIAIEGLATFLEVAVDLRRDGKLLEPGPLSVT